MRRTKVRVVPEVPFGMRVDYPEPPGIDLVVVVGNYGRGYIPIGIHLPHQIYAHELKEWARARGRDPATVEFAAWPLRTGERIDLGCVLAEPLKKGLL